MPEDKTELSIEDVTMKLLEVEKERNNIREQFDELVKRYNTVVDIVAAQSANIQIVGGEIAKIIAAGKIQTVSTDPKVLKR